MKQWILDRIKRHTTAHQYKSIRKIYHNFISHIYSRNLNKLALYNVTDKWGGHWYTQHYELYFKNIRKKKLNILEIGVGGESNPNEGGASLRMWKEYFPNSYLYGIDIYDKSSLQEKRITIFKGSQADEDFLKKVCTKISDIDIIIDDGSHINEHVITSFETLFPFLKKGGYYAIEDIQTSYWPGKYEL